MQYRLSIIEGGRTSVCGNEIITGFQPGQCPCRTVSGITGFLRDSCRPVRSVLKKSSIPQGIMRMAERMTGMAERQRRAGRKSRAYFEFFREHEAESCGRNQYEP